MQGVGEEMFDEGESQRIYSIDNINKRFYTLDIKKVF